MLNPDHKKFIWYASLAGIGALLSLFLPSDYWLVCVGILSLTAGFYGFISLLKSPDSRFNFFIVGATVIVLASSLGMLFSFMSMSIVSADIWSITLDYAHTTTTDIAFSQVYANVFACTLLLIGSQKKVQQTMMHISQDIFICLRKYRQLLFSLISIIIICQFYLINIGVVVYGGKDLADEGEPTHPLLSIILPLVPILPVILAYYLQENFIIGNKSRVVWYFLLLFIELLWFFLFGRRSVIYFFLLTCTGFFLHKPLSVSFIIKNFLLIFLCCYTALKIADYYHKMRVVYSFEQVQRMNMTDVISGLQSADDETYGKLRNMNVAARAAYSSLALGQFMNLFRTTNNAPLMGKELMNSILFATPSSLLVDKKTILAKEALYEQEFSLGLTDISETLYLESYVDFGWLGFFLYPFFIFILFSLIYSIVDKVGNPLFSLLVGCISLSLALMMVEVDMITFLATIRTLFICYVATVFFKKPAPSQADQQLVSNQQINSIK